MFEYLCIFLDFELRIPLMLQINNVSRHKSRRQQVEALSAFSWSTKRNE